MSKQRPSWPGGWPPRQHRHPHPCRRRRTAGSKTTCPPPRHPSATQRQNIQGRLHQARTPLTLLRVNVFEIFFSFTLSPSVSISLSLYYTLYFFLFFLSHLISFTLTSISISNDIMKSYDSVVPIKSSRTTRMTYPHSRMQR